MVTSLKMLQGISAKKSAAPTEGVQSGDPDMTMGFEEGSLAEEPTGDTPVHDDESYISQVSEDEGSSATSEPEEAGQAAPAPESVVVSAEQQEVESSSKDVDVDKMSASELDGLVVEFDVGVPAHWWKKTDGIKKMTVGEKRAWLNEKFGVAEGGDESPTPQKPEMSQESKSAEDAQVAKEAIAQVKAEMSEEEDSFAHVVHEIENLGETEARHLALELSDETGFSSYKLGGVLSVIRANSWHEPHESFRKYVEDVHGFRYRKAVYLINNYECLTKSEIPWESVKHIGWTKLTHLAQILTQENLAYWVDVAEKSNVPTLIEMVKKTNEATNTTTPELSKQPEEPVVTTKTFKLHSDQREIVEEALTKAKEVSGTDVESVAFEHVCLEYLGHKPGGAKVELTNDQLVKKFQDLGMDVSLEILGTAFPDIEFSVSLIE